MSEKTLPKFFKNDSVKFYSNFINLDIFEELIVFTVEKCPRSLNLSETRLSSIVSQPIKVVVVVVVIFVVFVVDVIIFLVIVSVDIVVVDVVVDVVVIIVVLTKLSQQ